jgi:rhodanese-related sulfurtransferase
MIPSMFLIVVVLFAVFSYNIYSRLRAKHFAEFIDENDFEKGRHAGQMIDLRESKDFDAGHILGARNMPYSTIKMFYKNIRKDMPIYLYDQGTSFSIKTAILLGKKDYRNIYILKSGYRNWNGKTKK